MASVDETFDPNDLDSIDALLDEAEQEVTENLEEDTLLDEEAVKVEDLDEQVIAPETVDNEPPVADSAEQVDSRAQVANANSAEKADSKQGAEMDSDDFLSKRAAAQNQSNNGLSAAEMDAIKKLVLIFGSIIIVLALILIGIGIWGALAASNGLDEETQTVLEEIKAGTEKNTLNHLSSSKSMEAMEKKLDALSFQLEQVTADIAVLEGHSKMSANMPGSNVVAGDAVKVPVVEGGAVPPVVAPTLAAVPNSAISSQLTSKLNSVNYKMTKAQRRIDEVNRRVKNLQGQYSTLLRSVKVVEKQILDQQVKVQKEKQADKLTEQPPRYQYPAPDGAMYDQAHPDSYP